MKTVVIKHGIAYAATALALLGGGVGWKEAGHSCVVGVVGTEASITVSGWRAVSVCQAFVDANAREFYLRETPPVESVLCETSTHGRHYIVRDRGLMMIVGRTMCEHITEIP